jgi:hypothetical protein
VSERSNEAGRAHHCQPRPGLKTGCGVEASSKPEIPMTNRQEEASDDGWWNKPDEVGTHMNRLMLRVWDRREELSRVNREIEQWSCHLEALMKKERRL